MSMRWLGSMAVAAVMAFGAVSAEAATVVGTNGPFTINLGGSQGYGVSLNGGEVGDDFVADFLFYTDGAPDGGSSSIECIGGCANIKFASIELFERDGSNQPVGSAIATGTVGTLGFPFPTVDYGIISAFGNLAKGNYLVRTAGEFLTAGNASIGGTVTLTPIPGAALLFSSALAGIGFLRRRTAAAA